MTATTQSAPDITQDHFSQAARAGQDAMDTAIRAWSQPGIAAVSRAAQQETRTTHQATEQARRAGRTNAAGRKDT